MKVIGTKLVFLKLETSEKIRNLDENFVIRVFVQPQTNEGIFVNLAKIFSKEVKLSEKELNVEFARTVINGINKGEDISGISPECFSELYDEKSVAFPVTVASVFGLVLAGEGITAVLLFGLKNNALQVAFDFAKSALTLPCFGILAGVVTIGSGIAVIFSSK